MTVPGVNVRVDESAPARGLQTDTGTWFVVGLFERGPVEPLLVRSLNDVTRLYGARVAHSLAWDALDVYFREGGLRAYIMRAVGPSPVKASLTLSDGSTDTIRADALDYGAWSNALNVAVLAGDTGSERRIEVSHDELGILETSPSLATKAALVEWSTSSQYVRLVDLGVGNMPAVAAAAGLTAGTDDYTNVTDDSYEDALAMFGPELGPGQVSIPGRTTATAHGQLIGHAAARNRVALLDAPDTSTVATLVASAASAQAVSDARLGQMWAPWATAPGVVAGTTRTVPWSAVQAGLLARTDGLVGPGQPAAGDYGEARFVTGLTRTYSDADRQTLNEAGVAIAKMRYGRPTAYAIRSLADPDTASQWIEWAHSRLAMAIVAEGYDVGERFIFHRIDGARRKLAEFGAAIRGRLLRRYTTGELFGETAEDAFSVDVGPTVNTVETIAARQLRAVVRCKMSPAGEDVQITITKTALTETV